MFCTQIDTNLTVIPQSLNESKFHLVGIFLFSVCKWEYRASIYLLKVNNRNIVKRCEICSNLTINILEQRQ